MSQTVQKQNEESSNTEQDTESLDLENNLDKSWKGLYSRWKGQLEKDFEEDPSQKRKLYVNGSIVGSIPILYATLPVTTLLPLLLLTILYCKLIYKQDISKSVLITMLGILTISGLVFNTLLFSISILITGVFSYLRYR